MVLRNVEILVVDEDASGTGAGFDEAGGTTSFYLLPPWAVS